MASQSVELSASQARELTDRIKVGVEAIWELVKQAFQSRAWAALGYDSWDDYCTREFGTSRIRLPREERQEVVASMREIGMSTRAIASATGVNQSTISRGLSRDANASPESEPAPVVGTDGKTYTPKPRPEPEPVPAPGFNPGDLDEINNTEDEVRPVFQPPQEPERRPNIAPPLPPEPIDRDLERRANAKSSAPNSGQYVAGETEAGRNAKRFDALILARNILKDTRTLAGMLADTGGINGMKEHLEDIQAAIEAAAEANNGNGMDDALNNLLG